MKKITVLALSLVLILGLFTGCRRRTDAETSMPHNTDPLDTTYHTHPSTHETTRPSTHETTRPSTHESTTPSHPGTDATDNTEIHIPGDENAARRRVRPIR